MRQYWAKFSGKVCALKLIFPLTSMPTCWHEQITREQSTSVPVGSEWSTFIHRATFLSVEGGESKEVTNLSETV